jgi:hypothetical protein
VLANLAEWTASGGRWFIPLADPDLIAGTTIPGSWPGPTGGERRIDGIVWSFTEDDETTRSHTDISSLRASPGCVRRLVATSRRSR